jgi:hypothetical protein
MTSSIKHVQDVMALRLLTGNTDENERTAELTTIDPFASMPDASLPIVLFNLESSVYSQI